MSCTPTQSPAVSNSTPLSPPPLLKPLAPAPPSSPAPAPPPPLPPPPPADEAAGVGADLPAGELGGQLAPAAQQHLPHARAVEKIHIQVAFELQPPPHVQKLSSRQPKRLATATGTGAAATAGATGTGPATGTAGAGTAAAAGAAAATAGAGAAAGARVARGGAFLRTFSRALRTVHALGQCGVRA
eukprot:CAMPEP_0171912872 /NCGR_PEP_ID=MMETSP0993-20121228/11409_1 /TAXON_ID=483369 /ORGANISM="non described non described, Strain CCMP2098" /LENGTH=185 /DNA_ID=CAMNT_0012546789 /DNA_START=189 /DNA_END=745 /DNA_ORIENTATION=-